MYMTNTSSDPSGSGQEFKSFNVQVFCASVH